jgi:putative Ca2+/H+ antiporter (TMEM165/GDT1 family)
MTDSLFITAFIFIFLAALPGRTTFLMLLLAARGRPWVVFLGAALAFAAQSVISVLLGELLSFLSQTAIEIAAGLLFLYFAWKFWHESRRPIEQKNANVSLASVFFLIFMAEWGDVSQVAIATYSAQHDKLITLAAALSALILIVLLATITGAKLGRNIAADRIQKFAAIVFGCIGIYLLSRSMIG